MSETKFTYKKKFFDNELNVLLISIIALPFIVYKNGSLDLSFVSIFFTPYILFAYFSLSGIYRINISSNETEIINALGKKKIIPNKKIFYIEQNYQKEVKSIFGIIKTYKLEIKFPNQKFTTFKNEDLNYDDLIFYCKEKYTRSNKKTINYKFYIIPLLIICTGIFFLFFTRNCYKMKEYDNTVSIRDFGYKKLEGTFQDYKNIGKTSTSILIHLKEYPEFDFLPIISIQNSSEFDNKLSSKGEKITFFISPNEYNKKIKKTVSQKFYDKYFSSNEITIFKIE